MRSKKYQELERRRLEAERQAARESSPAPAPDHSEKQEAVRPSSAGQDSPESESKGNSFQTLDDLTSDEAAKAAVAQGSGKGKVSAVQRLKNMKRWQKILSLAVIVVLLLGVAGYAFVNGQLNKVKKDTLDKKDLS